MVSVTLEVPHYVYAGHLIGAKGKNIRIIQDHYQGVKINYQADEQRYVANDGTAIENFVGSWMNSSMNNAIQYLI